MAIDNKGKSRKKASPVRRALTVVGTTILSLFLIVIITGSIVATALTVYVMKFMDTDVDIDLANLEMSSSSFIYATDSKGNNVEIHKLNRDVDRVLVALEDVPVMVQQAFVCIEDERFYKHKGVDFKRTFAAFVNEFLHIFSTRQGGSTITQQLVKNITQDDDANFSRKIREIFRSMNLENYYTKDEIMEAYLNYIGFGGRTSGVEAASIKYFGKSVSEVSLAQAASLAAIPKNPEKVNPFVDLEANKKRQKEVLGAMLDNGVISDQEYEEALAADLELVDRKSASAGTSASNTNSQVQSYYVDMVVTDAALALAEKLGLPDKEAGIDELNRGGYSIYANVDLEMQSALEKKFLEPTTFASGVVNDPPQSAGIIMDYKGNVKAVVGGIGEKPGPYCWNRATMSMRPVGSCIKPISTYSYGIYNDLFHWSTVWQDAPIQVNDAGTVRNWPQNYSNRWSYSNYFTYDALLRSLNTVPAQIAQMATPAKVLDFMENRMQISTLVEADIDYSPVTVGNLTNGITLLDLVSAYQSFGNLGKIYPPATFSRIVDVNGNTVLEHDYTPVQALDPDSAYVMNRLLATVITGGPSATGRAAVLPSTPIVGKTGTSQDWFDIDFVGCSPDYVAGMWYGYDEPKATNKSGYYGSASVWKNMFGEIMENGPTKAFQGTAGVKELSYCTSTGRLAGSGCATAKGYYKPSNIPPTCNGVHGVTAETAAPMQTLPGQLTQPASETAPSQSQSQAPQTQAAIPETIPGISSEVIPDVPVIDDFDVDLESVEDQNNNGQ